MKRRDALIRLGLVATVIYTAPTITKLDQAKAAVPSHHCPPGRGGCGGPGAPGVPKPFQ